MAEVCTKRPSLFDTEVIAIICHFLSRNNQTDREINLLFSDLNDRDYIMFV